MNIAKAVEDGVDYYQNLILGISTICLQLNFSCALISTKFASFWMDNSMVLILLRRKSLGMMLII
jgi:hypothetical protein